MVSRRFYGGGCGFTSQSEEECGASGLYVGYHEFHTENGKKGAESMNALLAWKLKQIKGVGSFAAEALAKNFQTTHGLMTSASTLSQFEFQVPIY